MSSVRIVTGRPSMASMSAGTYGTALLGGEHGPLQVQELRPQEPGPIAVHDVEGVHVAGASRFALPDRTATRHLGWTLM